MEGLVESKGVEEDKQRHDDSINKSWNLGISSTTGLNRIHDDDYPGNESGHASENKRQALPISRLFVFLLQRPKENHGCVHGKDSDKGSKVTNSGQLSNQPNHHRRGERILNPAEIVAVLPQAIAVSTKEHWRRDKEVEKG